MAASSRLAVPERELPLFPETAVFIPQRGLYKYHLLREITTKGAQSRFVKAAPGQFALRPTA